MKTLLLMLSFLFSFIATAGEDNLQLARITLFDSGGEYEDSALMPERPAGRMRILYDENFIVTRLTFDAAFSEAEAQLIAFDGRTAFYASNGVYYEFYELREGELRRVIFFRRTPDSFEDPVVLVMIDLDGAWLYLDYRHE